jgi:hypothetical protein
MKNTLKVMEKKEEPRKKSKDLEGWSDVKESTRYSI